MPDEKMGGFIAKIAEYKCSGDPAGKGNFDVSVYQNNSIGCERYTNIGGSGYCKNAVLNRYDPEEQAMIPASTWGEVGGQFATFIFSNVLIGLGKPFHDSAKKMIKGYNSWIIDKAGAAGKLKPCIVEQAMNRALSNSVGETQPASEMHPASAEDELYNIEPGPVTPSAGTRRGLPIRKGPTFGDYGDIIKDEWEVKE
jgi:hypothetical protein